MGQARNNSFGRYAQIMRKLVATRPVPNCPSKSRERRTRRWLSSGNARPLSRISKLRSITWGYLLAKNGQFSEAIVQFKRVVVLDPRNASAHHNLALAYAKSGNDAAAQPKFEAACRLDSSWCPSPDQR